MSKDQLTRAMEKLNDTIFKAIHATTTNGDTVRTSKAYEDCYYGTLQWNTIKTYQTRLLRLIAQFPEFADLTTHLDEIVGLAAQVAEIVKADKARKQAKRDRPKPLELTSGAKVPINASRDDITLLLTALDAERAKHIDTAAASAMSSLKLWIAKSETTELHRNVFQMFGIYGSDRDYPKALSSMSSQTTMDRIVSGARRDAAYDFDSFVIKLAGKIASTKTGPVRQASLAGTAWEGCGLTVVTTEKQVWRTHRIVNHSPLGKAFYQWPTRLID